MGQEASELVIRWYRADLGWFVGALLMGEPVRAAAPRYGVFLVEDHAGMRRALRRLVERSAPFRFAGEAGTAEEALVRIGTEPPQLVLVDINLPGMSGIELIARLAEQHPYVKCVVVSAYAEPERVRAAMEAGARGFVSKDEPSKIIPTLTEVAAGR